MIIQYILYVCSASFGAGLSNWVQSLSVKTVNERHVYACLDVEFPKQNF